MAFVRGVDVFGHFDLEPAPRGDLDDAAQPPSRAPTKAIGPRTQNRSRRRRLPEFAQHVEMSVAEPQRAVARVRDGSWRRALSTRRPASPSPRAAGRRSECGAGGLTASMSPTLTISEQGTSYFGVFGTTPFGLNTEGRRRPATSCMAAIACPGAGPGRGVAGDLRRPIEGVVRDAVRPRDRLSR